MVCRRPVTQVGQLYQDAVSVSDVVSLSVPEQGVICSSLTMRTFSCPRHCLCPAGTGLHCSMVSAGVKTFQLSPEVMPLSPGWLQGSSQSSDHLHGLPPPGSHGRVTLLRGKTEVLGLVRTLWHPQSFAGCLRHFPCVTVGAMVAAVLLQKMCARLDPSCWLLCLLIKPCLPGNQILCTLLYATNSPNFPVTI